MCNLKRIMKSNGLGVLNIAEDLQPQRERRADVEQIVLPEPIKSVRRLVLWSRMSLLAVLSLMSLLSIASVASLLSVASILSIGSASSALSAGSANSVLSVASVNSVLSIGCVGEYMKICFDFGDDAA